MLVVLRRMKYFENNFKCPNNFINKGLKNLFYLEDSIFKEINIKDADLFGSF